MQSNRERGKQMGKLDIAEGRTDMHLILPENLKLVTEKNDPLFDERVNMPLDEALVLNVMMFGVKEPVLVRKDGDVLKVVAGRQRVRAATEANKRLVKAGKEPMAIRCVMERGTDDVMLGIMILENEARIDDDPMVRAEKLQRYMAMGKTEEEAAITFNKPLAGIKMLLKLLDCSPKVQKAVTTGKVSASAAAKISELERSAQDEALDEALADVEPGKQATFAKVYNKVQETKVKKGVQNKKVKGAVFVTDNHLTRKQVKKFYTEHKEFLSEDAIFTIKWVLEGKQYGVIGDAAKKKLEKSSLSSVLAEDDKDAEVMNVKAGTVTKKSA